MNIVLGLVGTEQDERACLLVGKGEQLVPLCYPNRFGMLSLFPNLTSCYSLPLTPKIKAGVPGQQCEGKLLKDSGAPMSDNAAILCCRASRTTATRVRLCRDTGGEFCMGMSHCSAVGRILTVPSPAFGLVVGFLAGLDRTHLSAAP